MPHETQRHKQCAAQSLHGRHVPARAGAALPRAGQGASRLGPPLRTRAGIATVKKYWSREQRLFVNNLPWLAEGENIRLCRSLAGHSDPFQSMPAGRHGHCAEGPGRLPSRNGLVVSSECWLAFASVRPRQPRRRCDQDIRKALGDDGLMRFNNTLQEAWQTHPTAAANGATVRWPLSTWPLKGSQAAAGWPRVSRTPGTRPSIG